MGGLELGFLNSAGFRKGVHGKIDVCTESLRRVPWDSRPKFVRVVRMRAMNDDLGFTDVKSSKDTKRPKKQIFEGPEAVLGLVIASVAVLVDILKSIVLVFTGPISTNARLSQRVRVLEKESSNLKADKVTLEEDLGTLLEVESALQVAEVTKARISEQSQSLRGDVEERDNIIKSLSEEKGKLTEQIRSFNKKSKVMADRRQEFENQKASMELEMQRLLAKTGELESKLRLLEQENANLRREHLKVAGLQAKITDLESTLLGMKKNIAGLSYDNDTLLRQLSAKNLEYAKLEGKYTGVKGDVNAKKDEVSSIQTMLELQVKGNDKLREENTRMLQKMEAAQSVKSQLEQDLQKTAAEKERVISELRQQERAKGVLQEQMSKMNKQDQQGREALEEELKSKIKTVDEEKLALEERIKEAEGARDALQKEWEYKLVQKALQVRDLEKRNREIEKALAEAREMGMAWENYNSDLEAQYKELEVKYNEVEGFAEQQREETARAREEVKLGKDRAQKLEENLMAASKEVEDLRARTALLEDEREQDLESLKSEKEMLEQTSLKHFYL
ncbi:hypothetical protein NDN08_007797 [Rhodosorus marinus]|uniref:Uncharacterized protein n=1 Tax=Rhodosorus marinus TaxID=101924 RepID=A0AAV8UZS1_9RHOD|nr:hypothetical protein NDN08_007797 [Rhodosorus marinus]